MQQSLQVLLLLSYLLVDGASRGETVVFPFAAIVSWFSCTQQTVANHRVLQGRSLIRLLPGMIPSEATLKIYVIE